MFGVLKNCKDGKIEQVKLLCRMRWKTMNELDDVTPVSH